ncbi:MAG: thioredoxin family protein [Candidatus Thalassarchaeaceae archaeon]|nr:MAG: thioredoxin family protein [Euryarchaeota archaeon]RPG74788.1 MAG: thioredoxin family protein [Euryarchaeota archaeon TMED85]|tara:strand:+ start:462 stop:1052 length:591 start_codon:yes stop_codon:yes gene_type:complete
MPSARGLEPGDTAADFKLRNARSFVMDEIDSNSSKNPFKPVHMTLEQTIGETGGVIMFTCNHCPYVVASEERIESIASFCRENGLGFVGINSNDSIVYSSDNWDNMIIRAGEMSYPYLHDFDQTIAHAYGAERTPEFYLIDGKGIIVYRGRLDDSPRDPTKATTSELLDAINSTLSNSPIGVNRTDPIGCSVKWKE